MGKITKFDAAVLGMTAVFLIGMGTCCWRDRVMTQPWRVEVGQTAAASAPAREEPVLSKLLEGERININTASAGDLQRLPGIGEKRAQAIVTWREENGPFEQTEDLVQVPGIGEGILAQCRDYVTVEE